ncbi:PP2C family protein-serine/threonine phosphatase [Streptomyces pactum]|uniref:PP2C family protein-serine/threonine phosphatase n=1 Tax=Streptomyces pactum TaxID=68249 RepID=UPI0036F72F29
MPHAAPPAHAPCPPPTPHSPGAGPVPPAAAPGRAPAGGPEDYPLPAPAPGGPVPGGPRGAAGQPEPYQLPPAGQFGAPVEPVRVPPAVPAVPAVPTVPAVPPGPPAPTAPPGGAPAPAAAPAAPATPVTQPAPAAPPAPTAAPAAPAVTPAAPATPAAAPVCCSGVTTGFSRCAACQAGTVDKDGYCENCGHAQPRERDRMEFELGGVAAATDRGLRHHRNEDAFAVCTAALADGSPAVVAVVCDGVSSATRPDDASAAAAGTAGDALARALPRGEHPRVAMREAILAAAEAVNALAREPGEDGRDPYRQENSPACTIVGAVVAGGVLTVGWVGDSRAYWVPDDRTAPPARLTEDDSWAAQMVAAGLMTEEEAYADERAHAITGWLGADAYDLDPHTASFEPDRPGVVVVCTDGLWNYAESPEDMAGAVPPDARSRPLHSARVLVEHALDGGGHDNVTVAVLPFPVPPEGAGSA